MNPMQPNFDMNTVVGRHDIVLITLDTLRYDAAQRLFEAGRLPVLARHLPASGWERRHTPGSFTYAAHHAFFAGFLPTPAAPGRHPRLFAAAFPGSETTAAGTCVFNTPDIVSGLQGRGYRTFCLGGVGFFNLNSPLGKVLPSLFEQAEWCPEWGVTQADSTERQVARAVELLADCRERAFLFINVSAIHQPNRHYLHGCQDDCLESHMAAMQYVDGALAPMFDALAARGGALVIACSDHGTAYGDNGYHGHRIGHPAVWDVPYAQFMIPGQP
jgi:hypothetical protein